RRRVPFLARGVEYGWSLRDPPWRGAGRRVGAHLAGTRPFGRVLRAGRRPLPGTAAAMAVRHTVYGDERTRRQRRRARYRSAGRRVAELRLHARILGSWRPDFVRAWRPRRCTGADS